MLSNKSKHRTDTQMPEGNHPSDTGKNYTAPNKRASEIVIGFLLAAIFWLAASDWLTSQLIADAVLRSVVQRVLLAVGILIFGGILHLLVNKLLSSLERNQNTMNLGNAEMHIVYNELEAAYEELRASDEELEQKYLELLKQQEIIKESEERYRLISEATNDGIWDEHDNVRFFSERWYEITGYTPEELEEIGDWRTLVHPDDREMAFNSMEKHLNQNMPFYSCEYRLRVRNGGYMWIQTRGKALFDEKGKPYRLAGSHTDITELKNHQKKLHMMAYYDELTGLPNRRALLEMGNQELLANPLGSMALFFLDVDNFKFINETMGHNFGDRLIKGVCDRLKEYCGSRHVLYRIDGDEFVILGKDIHSQRDADTFARSLLSLIRNSFKIGDSILHINVSVGSAIYPQHGTDITELLRCADVALYQAKEAGGKRYLGYASRMNDAMLERMLLERHLLSALEYNEFELNYQPQFDIVEKRIIGFEALLRWKNRELGQVSPMKFIQVAEETHFIIPLGTWVLRNACRFLKKLHDAGNHNVTMAVNISVLQIMQEDFIDMVNGALAEFDLPPESLELEITETVLIESYDEILQKLHSLYARGIHMALDDFGKGYSSLSYLRQLPISTLKIDKTFVDHILNAEEEKPLTGQIVNLGQSIGLNVIAEGVETKEQLEYLARHSCRRIQGYFFSKPLREAAALKLLA